MPLSGRRGRGEPAFARRDQPTASRPAAVRAPANAIIEERGAGARAGAVKRARADSLLLALGDFVELCAT
jgi:hypothetical protein